MQLDEETLVSAERDAAAAIGATTSVAHVEGLRREWLGKEGRIRTLFALLREVAPEEKVAVASRLNALKASLEKTVVDKEQAFAAGAQAEGLKTEFYDLSLPGLTTGLGHAHPITLVERKISQILRPFGFRAVSGPEIETEYYCFDALNIQRHHPARDMQDTFFTEPLYSEKHSGGLVHVLRTHTTSVQSRTLEKGGAPLKIASFGRAYRNETEDASHQAMFHQYELVWVEKGLTLANLMALITHIMKGLYGKRRKVRFVAKHYPYTEPSIGPQIDCTICAGKGCPACGGAGWVTVAGAGMIHRNVLLEFNYNPDEVAGFAFGLGTSRLASQFFDMPRLKMCYEHDLRVLRTIG